MSASVFTTITKRNLNMKLSRIYHYHNYICAVRSNLAANFGFRGLCDKPPKKDSDKGKESSEAVETKPAEVSKKIAAQKMLDDLLKTLDVETNVKETDASEPSSISDKLGKPSWRQTKGRPAPTLEEIPPVEKIAKGLNDRLDAAVEAVSSKVGGSEGKQVKSDLLKILQSINDTTKNNIQKRIQPETLDKVIKGMRVDKYSQEKEAGQFTRGVGMESGFKLKPPPLQPRGKRSDITQSGFSMFSGTPLGIFPTHMEENPNEPKLKTWTKLQNHELEMQITHSPANAFEEMIRWTEEGKLWQYPINNEQGLEEEAKVPFYEHVILDEHLEGFPTSGVIREFMEVVLIGLSKNPYITVERKIAYIDWYREYFKSKEEKFKAVGVV